VAADVKRQYGVHALGHAEGVRERFYAITLERRIRHPGAAAIAAAARERLFH
jgi:LysR family transcriptional activator of nhaA